MAPTRQDHMHFLALASDYDGTLASDGGLSDAVIDALERCRDSGRLVVLVTGREMADLTRVCPRLDLFSRVVAENGAVLFDPRTARERLLAGPASTTLAEALRRRRVAPLSVGRVIIATREPHEATVLDTIRELGLEHDVIFNKGAVMILPSGMNKSVGLRAALAELGIARHRVVGVGDGENDHSFLAFSGCAVAVANALPSLKAEADLVTQLPDGAGVTELIDRLIADDLADVPHERGDPSVQGAAGRS